MSIERKLTAIMFTYIAGSTEQMSKDEAVAIIILGNVPFNNLADLNADGFIDVLDIILFVNIILIP